VLVSITRITSKIQKLKHQFWSEQMHIQSGLPKTSISMVKTFVMATFADYIFCIIIVKSVLFYFFSVLLTMVSSIPISYVI
jgi:hypothetical protein